MHIIPCLIVKNEEKIIQRCLESLLVVSPFAICICDTGSSDKTMEIAKDFSNVKHIPLKLIQTTWKSFGKNRSEMYIETVKYARELELDLKETYALFIDADMTIQTSIGVYFLGDLLRQLNDDAYEINYINGDVIYRKPTLVKLTHMWKSIGDVHEYWTTDEGVETTFLSAFALLEINDGKSREEKYTRDLEILIKGNCDDARTQFYLAQTYRDMKRYKEAITWYNARIKTGGWDEETWYSKYMLARCNAHQSEILLNSDEIVRLYIDAYEFRPTRAEPLFYLALYLLRLGRLNLAFAYINLAKEIPFPSRDILFVEYKLYDYLVDSLWITLAEKHLQVVKKSFGPTSTEKEKTRTIVMEKEMLTIAKDLLLRGDILEEEKAPALGVLGHAADLLDSFNIVSIDIPDPEDVFYSSIIDSSPGYKYLVQRQNSYIVYEFDNEFEIVRSIADGRIHFHNPRLVNLRGIIHIKSDTEDGFQLSTLNGEVVMNIHSNGVYYNTMGAVPNIMNLSYIMNLSGKKTKISCGKFSLTFLNAVDGPIYTRDGSIWLTRLMDTDVYFFVLIEDFQIRKISDPVKFGKFPEIESMTVNSTGQIVLSSKLKITVFSVGYILEMFRDTK